MGCCLTTIAHGLLIVCYILRAHAKCNVLQAWRAGFYQQRKIKKHMQGIIASHNLGDTITDLVAVDLLRFHPDWAIKSVGIVRLF